MKKITIFDIVVTAILIAIVSTISSHLSIFKPKQTLAYVCDGVAPSPWGWHYRGCGYNPCTADSRYNTKCYCNGNESCCADCSCPLQCGVCGYTCCSPSNGDWSACNATGVVQTCGSASCGGSQNCSPAGGTQQCCLVTTGACSITTNYNTSTTVTGCANGTLTISGGTTTINSGKTFDFGTLIVSTGYITIPVGSTGVIKTNAACN